METEWVDQASIVWTAEAHDPTKKSVESAKTEPGYATIVSVMGAMRVDLVTQAGEAFELDTLSKSGNRMQVGRVDLAAALPGGESTVGEAIEVAPPVFDEPWVETVQTRGAVVKQDLLVVYSEDAKNLLGGEAQTKAHIAARVSEANTAYNRSDVDITLRLVDTIEIDYNEVGGDGEYDLNHFYLDHEVVDNRAYGGADIVVFAAKNFGYCGKAMQMKSIHLNHANRSRAYAIYKVFGCGVGVNALAHEIGHLQGAQHDPGHASEGAYSYSRGHFEDNHSWGPDFDFRTLMSYDSDCIGNCPRILNFSNPSVDYVFEPTGTSSRDNARTLNNTRNIVSGYTPAIPLTDVFPGDYYYLPAGWMKAKGITSGCNPPANDRYCPSNTITRWEFMIFLWRAHGSPTSSSYSEPFTDVNPGDWWYNAVRWAYSRGLTNGCTSTTFCPHNNTLRYEQIVFIWRAEGSPTSGSYSEPFTDVNSSHWWHNAVKWAYSEGVTDGCSATKFCSTGIVTRGETAASLWNAEYR